MILEFILWATGITCLLIGLFVLAAFVLGLAMFVKLVREDDDEN